MVYIILSLLLLEFTISGDCGFIPHRQDNGLTFFSVTEYCALNHEYDLTIIDTLPDNSLTHDLFYEVIEIPKSQLENFELTQFDEFTIKPREPDLIFTVRIGKIGYNFYELVIENNIDKVTIDGE